MLTQKEVKHVASLARIGVNKKEIKELEKDLSVILAWIKKLKKADVTDVDPLEHITERENIMREDKVNVFENNAILVDLFPEKKDGYDKVRSVL